MYVTGNTYSIGILFDEIRKALVAVGWTPYKLSEDTYIYCGTGSGQDKIYIMISYHNLENKIIIDSAVGYDDKLGFFEQPGCLQQYLKSEGKYDDEKENFAPQYKANEPAFTITKNERFFYWIFVDTYRIIVVCRMSIVYESMYLGFLNPIASERQYPYPMYVCGNTVAGTKEWTAQGLGSFVFPNGGSGWLRRADGNWRAFNASKPNPSPSSIGTVFPYTSHNTKLIPNYKETDSINQDNFLLIPIMLQTNDPVDLNGLLRGCYWISGARDIDAERILQYDGRKFIVFDTQMDRGANTYFAIKIEEQE